MSDIWASIFGSAIELSFDDASELVTGARLAKRMTVDLVEVAPGAMVLRDPDSNLTAHLGIQPLDDRGWETLVEIIVADPRLIAAVVTGDLPVDLHGRAVERGCSLVPERRQLGADCTCPDWREPCKHVGALVALVRQMIERDPWLLAMLRGRTRDQIVEAVRRQSTGSGSSDTPRGVDHGVPASQRFASHARDRTLPSPLPALRRPGKPVSYRPPPADAGVHAADLESLAADAAERAFRLLAGDVDADALLIDPADDLRRRTSDRNDLGH